MKEGETKDQRTAIERVREMLEVNRELMTEETYKSSLLTLQAVKLAEEEIRKEKCPKE